jgi:hypothetical protein
VFAPFAEPVDVIGPIEADETMGLRVEMQIHGRLDRAGKPQGEGGFAVLFDAGDRLHHRFRIGERHESPGPDVEFGRFPVAVFSLQPPILRGLDDGFAGARLRRIGGFRTEVETLLHAEDAQQFRLAAARLDRFRGERFRLGGGFGVEDGRRRGQKSEKEESGSHGVSMSIRDAREKREF